MYLSIAIELTVRLAMYLSIAIELTVRLAMYPAEDNEFITPELFQTYMKALSERTCIAKYTCVVVVINVSRIDIRQKKQL